MSDKADNISKHDLVWKLGKDNRDRLVARLMEIIDNPHTKARDLNQAAEKLLRINAQDILCCDDINHEQPSQVRIILDDQRQE